MEYGGFICHQGGGVKSQITFFVLLWAIPIGSIHSPGWITTTTNYLWVLVLGLVALRPVKHWLMQEKLSVWEYAICPPAFYWGIGHLGNAMLAHGMFPVGGHWIGVLGMNRQLPELGNYPASMVAVQAIAYLFLLGCIAASIYFIHGRSKETLLQFVILAAGFLSRIIMGFSPTIYASGDRTALFCSAAVLIVTLRNLQFYLDIERSNWRKWVTGGYIGAVILCNLCV